MLSRILAMDSLSETKKWRCSGGTAGSTDAMTSGMPEPVAPGAKRRVSQTMAAVQAGVQISGVQRDKVRNSSK